VDQQGTDQARATPTWTRGDPPEQHHRSRDHDAYAGHGDAAQTGSEQRRHHRSGQHERGQRAASNNDRERQDRQFAHEQDGDHRRVVHARSVAPTTNATPRMTSYPPKSGDVLVTLPALV
jgi:hypothetical protein